MKINENTRLAERCWQNVIARAANAVKMCSNDGTR